MENIKSEELEEFKELVVKFAEKDFSGRVKYYVEQMLESGSLPEKVGEHDFLLRGDFEREKNARLYLSDTVYDRDQDLHSLTAKYDSEMSFEKGSVPVHSDILVEELRNGYFRANYETSERRYPSGQLDPSDIKSSRTYEFDIGGDLLMFEDKNKVTNEVKSSLYYDKKTISGICEGKITKGSETYTYGADKVINFKDLHDTDISSLIDYQISMLQENNVK